MRLFLREQDHGGPGTKPFELKIDDSKPLGKGATALVYNVHSPEFSDKVVKVYHNRNQFDRAKIRAMLADAPALEYGNGFGPRMHKFAWPSHIVYNNANSPVGYLMPRIGSDASLPLNFFFERMLATAELPINEQSLTARVRIAYNISSLLAELHAHEHYVIDFKPQNTKVSVNGLYVTLLDCDSFSIHGRDRRFPATNYSSEYIAPEALASRTRPQELLEHQDRFALAVVLFQLLNNGVHPFQGILRPGLDLPTTDDCVRAGFYPYGRAANPAVRPCVQSIHECFDDEIRRLFDQAFTGWPEGRPTASEWTAYFKSILDEKKLQRCEKRPNDPTHIRFRGKPCGLCHFDSVLAAPLKTLAKQPSIPSGYVVCPACEMRAPIGLTFCPSCGHRRTASLPTGTPTPRPTPTPSPTPQPPEGVSVGKRFLIFLLACALVAGGVYFLGRQEPMPPPGRSEREEPPKPPPPPDAEITFATQHWRTSVTKDANGTVIQCVAFTSRKMPDDGFDPDRILGIWLHPGISEPIIAAKGSFPVGVAAEFVGLEPPYTRYTLYGDGEYASPASTDIDAVLKAMKDGLDAQVQGPRSDGTFSVDEYSLRGVRATYAAAARECGVPAK